MKGYAGNILFIDLTTQKIRMEEIDKITIEKYIGGRGLAAKIFYDIQERGIDPLSEKNNIVIATGPFTGTIIPTGSKYVIVTKSPATGAFLDSYASGILAHELKCAGFDAMVVTGKSKTPCIIVIENDDVKILDGSAYWGKDTVTTETQLKNQFGKDFGVMCIGPAGENLSLLSGINSDYFRQAARGGGGAVFGSKNLKAVIVKGTKFGISCDDAERIMEIQKKHKKQLQDSFIGSTRKKYGTPYTLNFTNATGMLPTRNFQTGVYKEAENMIDAFGVESLTVRSKSCLGCMESCSKVTEVKDGPFKGSMLEGPEYETLALLGSNLCINYLPAIIKSNILCNELGLDTISVGGTIGFAMECYEKGLITKKDTDGREIAFGDYKIVHKLIEDIAYNRGFGKILGLGVKRASQVIGKDSYKFAVEVKGMEFPGYDPRGSFGSGLSFAATPRGACHRRCWPASNEIVGEGSPYDPEGKAELVKKLWDENNIYHSLLICDFPSKHAKISLEDLSSYYIALTGAPMTENDLADLSERSETLIRMYNYEEGLSRKDDYLPYRIMNDPMPEGPAKGQHLSQGILDKMLDDYYALRGWNKDGYPTEETIDGLGICGVKI